MTAPIQRTPDSAIPTLGRVLATSDFSELAERAIPLAYAIAARGGRVHLLHVIDLDEPAVTPNPLYAHYSPGRAPTPGQRAAARARCEARLRASIPAGADARDIATQIHVVEAREVAAAILSEAARSEVDVLCLASRGRTGLAAALLGSVARAVLARSQRPVLIVPPPA
jgi:nucleotide-binding universal stress UspA family protein